MSGTEPDWDVAPGRLWPVPGETRIFFLEDTPIFNALYWKTWPLRWVIGGAP